MENTTIQKLSEVGFKIISVESLRSRNWKEVIEYYDGNKWVYLAK